MKTNDRGNVLVEVVAFVSVAFVLVLESGLTLFHLEKLQQELSQIARNSLREHLLYPEENLGDIIENWKSQSGEFTSSQIDYQFSCISGCQGPGAIVQVRLSAEGVSVSALAVS